MILWSKNDTWEFYYLFRSSKENIINVTQHITDNVFI